MGICSSCCRRRRKKPDSDEEEPLLYDSASSPKRFKVADALAALKVGKLPSQEQVDGLARKLLKSDALNKVDGLSVEGQKVVLDTREFLQAILLFGLAKNYDDLIQEIVYRSHSELPTAAQAAGDAVVETADDTAAFLASLKQLIGLVLTSAAFRLVITTLVLTVRQAVSSAAQQIEGAAEGVEAVAQGVAKAATDVQDAVQPEQIATFDGETLRDVVKDVVEDVQVDMPQKTTERTDQSEVNVEDVVVNELQQILKEAQQNPEFVTALRTIVVILQKYISLSREASEERSQAAQNVDDLSSLFKILLERHALSTSFSPEDAERMKVYLGRVETLLRQPDQIDTEELRALVHDFQFSFPSPDPTTQKIWRSFEVLSADTVQYVAASSPSQTLGNLTGSVWRDLRNHFLPHLLSILWRADADGGGGIPLPIPRVEVVDESVKLQGVVDGRMMWGDVSNPPPSFWSCCNDEQEEQAQEVPASVQILPTSVNIQRWEETSIDMEHGGVDTSNRIHVRLQDVVASDKVLTLGGIRYFLNYGGVIGYQDEGIVDLRVRGGGGILVDIDLDLQLSDSPEFNVSNVQLTLPPTLAVYPTFVHTRHSLISRWVVEPLMKMAVKYILRKVIEKWLASTLDRAGKKAVRGDWVGALTTVVNNTDDNTEEEGEGAPGMSVTTTAKGVRLESEEGDMVVAVGIVPQIVPSKAVPEPPAVDEVVEEAEGAAREVREEIVDVVEEAGHIEARYEARREVEVRKDGWRSGAFDF